MKIKNGYILRKVGEQFVVISVNASSKGYNGLIKLNESGSYFWKLLETEQTEESMKETLMNKYNIEASVAERDIANFIDQLRKKNILDE